MAWSMPALSRTARRGSVCCRSEGCVRVVQIEHSFDFRSRVAKADETDHGVTNATNPDLSAFARHGGKQLMYHGWADGAIPPRASINYYADVVKKAGGRAMVDSWMRLFMVPGI
jgi:Tannase and feruloyl esterase